MAVESFVIPVEESIDNRKAFSYYREISGASVKDEEFLRSISEDVKGPDAVVTSINIRRKLLNKNFEYNEKSFTLQDVVKDKGGNCLRTYPRTAQRCILHFMTRKEFLSLLRRVIQYQAATRTVPCRCIGCCSEKQKRPSKTANGVSKPSCESQ